MSKIVISFYSDDHSDETIAKAKKLLSGLMSDLAKAGLHVDHYSDQDKAIGLIAGVSMSTAPEKRATVRKAQPIEAAPKQRKLI